MEGEARVRRRREQELHQQALERLVREGEARVRRRLTQDEELRRQLPVGLDTRAAWRQLTLHRYFNRHHQS